MPVCMQLLMDSVRYIEPLKGSETIRPLHTSQRQLPGKIEHDGRFVFSSDVPYFIYGLVLDVRGCGRDVGGISKVVYLSSSCYSTPLVLN